MNHEERAKIIFIGLKKYGLDRTFEDVFFADLPREYKTQLLLLSAAIPRTCPFEKLDELRKWCIAGGNYQTVETIDRFTTMVGREAEK